MLDLLIAVIKFVIFDLKSGEFLLNSVVVVKLLLEFSDLYLLAGDDRSLVQNFLLDGALVVLEADGLGLVASDHLPELTPRVVIQEKQRRETLINQLRL